MKFLENSLVYIIDDEPGIQLILADVIEEIGVKTRTFSSATSAFQSIKDDEPDLIISDIRMPEMDGVDFLIKLRGQNINTPVILLSAHISKEIMLNALEIGVYGFVEKPIKDIVFKSIIKNALAKSLFQKSILKKLVSLKETVESVNQKYDHQDIDIQKVMKDITDLEGMNFNFMRR